MKITKDNVALCKTNKQTNKQKKKQPTKQTQNRRANIQTTHIQLYIVSLMLGFWKDFIRQH